ncbi:MAG: excinuclease ABC subunit UvrA [Bacteroidales bacterium]|nr:excinuclease ABC subunit UvrA [Bacteroidales bacterium]
MAGKDCIFIKGARANNLKNIDVEIPRGKFVVITGVSGSGKSSLAFDTLYAEGHRRFAESLSSFARQFLGRVPKPAVDYITGIPPAIAVEQKVNTVNSRSTIATTTEIYNYLQLLYAKIGRTYSPVTGREVVCDTERSVLDYMLTLPAGEYALIAAAQDFTEENYTERFLSLKEEGYTRVVDSATGDVLKIDDVLSKQAVVAGFNHLALLVDRVRISSEEDADFTTRALDSLKTAFAAGGGHILCGMPGAMREFSNLFEADGITFSRPSENLFSYNSPLGACPVCGGFGSIIGIDENLVIPNPTLSVYDGAVACWRGELMKYFRDELVNNAYKFDFPVFKPYKDLTRSEKDVLWRGNEHFTGIDGFFEWVDKNRYKIQFKYLQSRYSGRTTCRECGGSRLRKEALYVRVGGKTIAELMSMQIRDLAVFFDNLQLDAYEQTLAAMPVKEIRDRLAYIVGVGLGYLTLDRASNTLSGGESQRINLVKVIGNNLVGSMYVLDEPSIGLHSRDTQRLITVLKQLRDLGNTVIVVEHDKEIIQAADQVIDIGPRAGSLGGEVVYQGPPALPSPDSVDWGANKSLTLEYLTGRRKGYLPESKHTPKYAIEVLGARENNLKEIDVRFPLRCLVAVTGVSGSGKSSLVGDILYPALRRQINQTGESHGAFRALAGDLNRISSVEYVDQNPIGKSSRSNPVTYTKVYDDIRKLFSEQPYAKMNGYGHSHFSFNIDGGRCPECQGEGVIRVEMQFMADVTMVCPSCGGKRFLPDILEVKYQGKSISDVLDMSVEEAVQFFSAQEDALARRIAERLHPLMDVGLSYLKLGQSSSTLSGGESQRIKLASFLGKDASSGPVLFIFDEPTTGLHFYDIEKLLRSFDALIAKGHSIIVVEHNLDIIRAADHIIELGPGAGDEGGSLIFEGTPEELMRMDTPTAAALNDFIGASL